MAPLSVFAGSSSALLLLFVVLPLAGAAEDNNRKGKPGGEKQREGEGEEKGRSRLPCWGMQVLSLLRSPLKSPSPPNLGAQRRKKGALLLLLLVDEAVRDGASFGKHTSTS